jgi:hypothetical protein
MLYRLSYALKGCAWDIGGAPKRVNHKAPLATRLPRLHGASAGATPQLQRNSVVPTLHSVQSTTQA